MKTCKNCGIKFPLGTTIDGKKVNLRNRSYCLACSPYKSNNRQKLENEKISTVQNRQRECPVCNRLYSSKGSKCISCYLRQRRENFKKKAVKYKGGKCKLCGYNKCIKALEFHHINEEDKDFDLSGAERVSWKRVEEELDKCILVCANCHREIHDGITSIE